MADLNRWQTVNPRDLRRAGLEQRFGGLLGGDTESFHGGLFPKTDIYEDQEGVTLRFEVPGLDASQVHLQLNESTLTVSGERKLDNDAKRGNYHRVEGSYGSFERSFALPRNLDTERLTAQYRNGLLQVFVPRSERAKPRSIEVKIDQK